MKKLFVLSITLLSVSMAYSQSSKAEMKQQFVNSCVEEILTATTDSSVVVMVKKYCECAGEKVVNHFSTDQIAAWGTMETDQIEAQIMPIIQKCTEQYKNDSEAYMKQKEEE